MSSPQPPSPRTTAEFINLPRMSGGTLVLFDVVADSLDDCFREVRRAINANHDLSPEYDAEISRIFHHDADLGPDVLEHSVAIVHETVKVKGPLIQILVRLARPLDLTDADGQPMHFLWVLLSDQETHPHIDAVAEFALLMGEASFRQTALTAATPDQLDSAYLNALADDVRLSVSDLPAELRATGRLAGGIVQDLQRRLPHYASDLRDGLSAKALASVFFMYFACLAPAVAFGGLLTVMTGGEIGTIEAIVAAALGGMAYALLAGQPLTILGNTGPIVIFLGILYSVCQRVGLPFMPIMTLVGLWTSLFLVLLAITDSCRWIRVFTRFTDDTFAALIALIFIYEALKDLLHVFTDQKVGHDTALLSLILAFGTYLVATSLSRMRRSPYLRRQVREFLADFGPAIAIISMSIVAFLLHEVELETLSVPNRLVTTSGRPWFVNPFVVPPWAWAASAGPALLLTILVYLDQNITVRLVNSPQHSLRKGSAYHLDLLVAAVLIAACSIFGLPWMVAATVRSLTHVRSLATVRESSSGREQITEVLENRLTAFCIFALIGASLLLLPIIKLIPMSVLFGVFLYMGVTSMAGNQLFERLLLWITDPKLYPPNYYLRAVPRRAVHRFTAVQFLSLVVLWIVKASPFGLVFPLFIALLVPVRFALKRFFKAEHLALLDAEEEPSAEQERFAGG